MADPIAGIPPIQGVDGGFPVNVTYSGAISLSPARVALSNTIEQTLIASPGVGQSLYVTDLHGSNEGNSNARIDMKEGAGGTIRYSFAVARNGGGFCSNLRATWKLPSDTALVVQQSVSTASYVTVNYYTAP
jgi:hypothetical protein